ncbi:Sak single strand annealing protein [Butyrivibrio sp. AE2032]|uniref:Sak single strand annealing protein n=1 Tax=Butyrivibrio sp. AE2032 TaxID=1458463 RepID=UPI000691FB66|nr:DUF1071 domain-containing protein [Butyrivibrio sp. AE2032]
MENYFLVLNAIDVTGKTEKKGNLTYLSWAWAWGELKKKHPDAFYTIYENSEGWFYHTDGKTAWVKTGVTVNGLEHIEYLPVMDYRNNSIPADKITSTDVNKTIQRSLTKAVARHGLGLYIYAGEDLPEDLRSEDEKAFDKKVEDDKKAIISKKDQAILENMVKSKGYAVNEIFPKGLAITGEQYTQALETLKTLKKKGE